MRPRSPTLHTTDALKNSHSVKILRPVEDNLEKQQASDESMPLTHPPFPPLRARTHVAITRHLLYLLVIAM